jgi:uncharacterized protein YcfJ
MKTNDILSAALLFKIASAAEEVQQPEDVHIKRRRMLARLIPTLLSALSGGAIGRQTGEGGMGRTLAGAGIGGAAGYGAGALVSNAKEWAGADPMLRTVRAV